MKVQTGASDVPVGSEASASDAVTMSPVRPLRALAARWVSVVAFAGAWGPRD